MPKYIVLRDNYGFHGGYWTKDQIVHFDEGPDKVPEHFELVGKHVVQEDISQEPETASFSEINNARKNNLPKTGMGYVAPEPVVEEKVPEKSVGKRGPKRK